MGRRLLSRAAALLRATALCCLVSQLAAATDPRPSAIVRSCVRTDRPTLQFSERATRSNLGREGVQQGRALVAIGQDGQQSYVIEAGAGRVGMRLRGGGTKEAPSGPDEQDESYMRCRAVMAEARKNLRALKESLGDVISRAVYARGAVRASHGGRLAGRNPPGPCRARPQPLTARPASAQDKADIANYTPWGEPLGHTPNPDVAEVRTDPPAPTPRPPRGRLTARRRRAQYDPEDAEDDEDAMARRHKWEERWQPDADDMKAGMGLVHALKGVAERFEPLEMVKRMRAEGLSMDDLEPVVCPPPPPLVLSGHAASFTPY